MCSQTPLSGITSICRHYGIYFLDDIWPVWFFLSDALSAGIDWVSREIEILLTNYGINPVVKSLVIDGIFTGVGSVLSFLPVILILFFFLSILEDTGYMARIAFVMDTFLRKIGLSGRSFVPMLLGFGCSVPAVMASRTLSSERDRNLTIMLIPFISCSAKIPIYTVFTAAFFPHRGVLVMSCLYFGWNRNWNFDGINFQKGFICRKANAVCHGTSELPFSFFKKRFTFNVGKGKGLLRKSIYDYLSCINDYLVSTDI